VDEAGRVTHVAGDAEVEVTLRSCVKPFALIALAEAGGFRDYGLTSPEIALMASSHSGEDLHVRTLQAVFRRSGLTQTLLACGAEGAPLDSLTSARLARDGERAGPIRHMCSGYHAAMLLLARLGDWSLEDYWQVAIQPRPCATVARAFATHPSGWCRGRQLRGRDLRLPLAAVAQAYAFSPTRRGAGGRPATV
jgi:L-asparaginase II